MTEKFATDLTSRPTMVTVRGQCRARDGQIHTDSLGKIITVLIYMNAAWEADGGRLRMLRYRYDIEDYAAEVPPREGYMVAQSEDRLVGKGCVSTCKSRRAT